MKALRALLIAGLLGCPMLAFAASSPPTWVYAKVNGANTWVALTVTPSGADYLLMTKVVTSAAAPLTVQPTPSSTWAATQSGTWTVQPGNTANTTPWLFQGISLGVTVYAAPGTPLNTTWSPTGAQFAGHPGWPVAIQPGSGQQVQLSVSKTGEWDAALLMTDTKTGITAIDTHGTTKITLSITVNGNNGVTFFIDCSNNTTAPNAYDPAQWCNLTPGGVVVGPAFNVSAGNGNVQTPPISVPSGYRWVRFRIESINGGTSLTVYAHGSQ